MDRRTGNYRRKVQIPVAVDRRKGERRSGFDRRQRMINVSYDRRTY